ncbi:MAG: hypothetical protein H6Q86_2129 [candidate division NC10 bacterium]|nr:hypothetical protein [candidate division NC10 bacterium]
MMKGRTLAELTVAALIVVGAATPASAMVATVRCGPTQGGESTPRSRPH